MVDDTDDIYSGFDEFNSRTDAENFVNDPKFQIAVRTTSHGRKPPVLGSNYAGLRATVTTSSGRLPTGLNLRGLTMANLRTSTASTSIGSGDGTSRPMTSVRAAGYTSSGRRVPTGMAGSVTWGQSSNLPTDVNAAPPLEAKPNDCPEERIKAMEKRVNQLIEESCLAAKKGDVSVAFEKAKDAGRKERVLVRQREQLGVADQINLDLTYSVLFNLANRYTDNGMYQEALNTYQAIVKNKMFVHAGRLKVNMGNIYFAQKNYGKAIKFYRMGLDQVPNTHKAMRKATAEGYIKMAAKLIAPSIESNFHTGYDWCIDQTKMSSFHEVAHDLEIDKAVMYLKQRDFHQMKEEEVNHIVFCFLNLGQQFSYKEFDFEGLLGIMYAGGNWSSALNSQQYKLPLNACSQAIDTLKSFERKDTRVASTAATNLSFLYFLEGGDLVQADRYADQALAADRYNPAALVNKGNVLFRQEHYERARDCYAEALQDDSSCVEALYNLGLTCKRLQKYEESLDAFFKLHAMLRNSATVVYQIMDIYERLDDASQAQEWAMQLHSLVPTDPFLLQRIGDNYEQEGDKSQAFSYYYDSFKYFPCNVDVIEWLGAYYIESQFCEKAIAYFERASLMQPNQPKWQLMIASCHRRSGNYQQALETYRVMHKRFPDNIECLRFLVRLSADMGLAEAQEYANRLKRAEKVKEAREHRQTSGAGAPKGPSAGGWLPQTTGSRESSNTGTRGMDSRETTERAALRSYGVHQSRLIDERLQPDEASFTYQDPLGPAAERPMTAARSRPIHDEFADEEVDDTLLPD